VNTHQTYTRDDLSNIVTTNVCDYGWHCVNVIEHDGCPPWSYSIGLYQTYGFPELIIIGRSRATSHHILETVADRLEKNELPDLSLPNVTLLPGVIARWLWPLNLLRSSAARRFTRERNFRIRPVAAGGQCRLCGTPFDEISKSSGRSASSLHRLPPFQAKPNDKGIDYRSNNCHRQNS
jgi:hypothetical protein